MTIAEPSAVFHNDGLQSDTLPRGRITGETYGLQVCGCVSLKPGVRLFKGESMKRLFSSTAAAFVIVIFFAATTSSAQDNIASRQAAADRYFKVAPMSKMLEEMLTKMAKKIPEDKRDKFVSQMREAIRVDVVERNARESMVTPLCQCK